MPRGKKTSHKGGRKQFSKPEEIERQLKQMNVRDPLVENAAGEKAEEDESSSEESSEDEQRRGGVHGLIEIENPNRQVVRSKKLKDLDSLPTDDKPTTATTSGGGAGGGDDADGEGDGGDDGTGGKPQLTRREREEIERQRHKLYMEKLRAEGKTEEARADLARLAIIRAERAEAARKRDEGVKVKELSGVRGASSGVSKSTSAIPSSSSSTVTNTTNASSSSSSSAAALSKPATSFATKPTSSK